MINIFKLVDHSNIHFKLGDVTINTCGYMNTSVIVRWRGSGKGFMMLDSTTFPMKVYKHDLTKHETFYDAEELKKWLMPKWKLGICLALKGLLPPEILKILYTFFL